MPLSREDSLDHIRSDAGRIFGAARAAGLDAPVPTCPDWTVAGLLRHIGRVHHWVAGILASKTTEPVRPGEGSTPPDDPADYPAWAEESAARLIDSLSSTEDTTEVWNWVEGVAPATFWMRRMVHETALHRLDADRAAGGTGDDLDPAVAADGLDEFATVLLPALGPRLAGGWSGQTVHLHRTDGDGEWLLRLDDGAVTATREHAKGDVAVRGEAVSLLLWAQNRAPVEALETFGDTALLDRWRASVRF